MKLILLLSFSVCLSLFSKETFPEKMKYSYEGINGKSQDIEVYFPEGHSKNSNAPCLIFFHGGGWSGGSLAQFRRICAYFASRGAVSITANYSLIPKEEQKNLSKGESKKRVCVIDGKTVIRWVKKNASTLGIDKEKIAAGGASAGGHISVLSMLDKKFNNKSDDKSISTDVKAFLLFCPAFADISRDRTPDVNVFNNLEGKLPPFLFIVGETDGWKKASDKLAEALAAKGANVEYWVGKDSGHMFFGKKEWIDECCLKADEFLVSNKLLSAPGPSKNTSGKKLVRVTHGK